MEELKMIEERTFQWKSVIWTAIVIFVLSYVLIAVPPTLYGTYIGFQTRGDMELVNLGVENLQSSPAFALYFYLVLAGISLWRGFVLTRKVFARVVLHVGVAGAIAAVLPLILAFVAGGGLSVEWGLQVVAILGGIYLGTYLLQRKSATAAVK
jgi:hypothetical protein